MTNIYESTIEERQLLDSKLVEFNRQKVPFEQSEDWDEEGVLESVGWLEPQRNPTYNLIYSLGVNRGNTREHEGRTRHLE
jgi:hypothetical protein